LRVRRDIGKASLIMASAFAALASMSAGAHAEAPRLLPPNAIEEFPLPIGPEGLGYPYGLAVGPEGDIWFGVTFPGRISRISPAGVITGVFTIPTGVGSNVPESSWPSSLALGADHDMWFIDKGLTNEVQNLIGRVTPAGSLAEFPIPRPPGSSEPVAIARGSDGDMWFIDQTPAGGEPSFIGRVNHAGEITEFPIPEPIPGVVEGANVPGHSLPADIALGADGNLWFTDDGTNSEGHNLVGRITPAGVVSEFPIPAQATNPGGIALGADGNMWFTQSNGTVGRVTPAGVVSEYTATGMNGYAGGIVLGPDGNMWFGEEENLIGRMTLSGAATIFSRPGGENLNIFTLVQGIEHDLWYQAGGDRFVRLTVPFVPSVVELPVISGGLLAGDILSVSEGSWLGSPSSFAYQWQLCDQSGLECEGIPGAVNATEVLTADEIGHTLRAIVTASNIAGATVAESLASPLVQSPPAPPPEPKPPAVVEPTPVVASAMTWNFSWAHRYTRVDSLIVRGVPSEGVVEVSCHGRGCAFARWLSSSVTQRSRCKRGRCAARRPTLAHGEVSLAALFAGRRLRVGARIVVMISRAGWMGKSFAFTIRANQPPRVQIACLGAGLSSSAGEC